MRPPTVMEPNRVIAGVHPCAWGSDDAPETVRELRAAGVTLFVDLTLDGELPAYDHLVEPPARSVRAPVRDLSVPELEDLVSVLDTIDDELERGGIVYVHCWAGCGRTGVVVGCWLVRHGLDPHEALERIAETRGRGCPQTLEQRLLVLSWEHGQ